MKKQLLALAALAAVSGVAVADATVYGFIDAGLYTTNNGGNSNTAPLTAGNQSVTAATSGMWFPSMIGITGGEDLGAGTKARFNLQGSLGNQSGAAGDVTTSTGTSLFGRYATVGLTGNFGALDAGRQINNMFLQSFSNGVIATHTNSLAVNGLLAYGGTNTNQSTAGAFWNNVVQYSTPTLNGLEAKLQYLVGGAAGSSDTNSAYNVVGTYKVGAFGLSAGYEQSKGTVSASGSSGGTLVKNLLGAKFSAGQVDFAAQYNSFKSDTGAAANKVNAYEIGAAYHVSPALLVGVNFEVFNQSGSATRSISSLKAKYDFSKRTYAYGLISGYNSAAAGAMPQGYATTLGTNTSSATGFGIGVVHGF